MGDAKRIELKPDPDVYNGKALPVTHLFCFHKDPMDELILLYGAKRVAEMMDGFRPKSEFVPKGKLIVYGTGGEMEDGSFEKLFNAK